MQAVTIFVGGSVIAQNAPFQRVPVLGEFVVYQGQWAPVTWVGHDFIGGVPVAKIILQPVAHSLVAPPAEHDALDPDHPFPGGHK